MGDAHDYEQNIDPNELRGWGGSRDALYEDCPECGDYSSSQPGVEGCTSSSCSRFMGDDKLKDYVKRTEPRAQSKPTSPPDRGKSRGIDVKSAMSGPTLFDMLDKIPGHGSHHEDGKPSYMDEDSEPSYMDKVMSGEYDPDTIEDEGKSYDKDDTQEDFLPGDDYTPPF